MTWYLPHERIRAGVGWWVDFEKLHLINQLQEDDKQTVYKIIDTMLTKQKFQTFFEQNSQISK